MKDHRIILALASGFLQKAVRPREVATLIRNFSENAGDLRIGWRELARFLCVSERFLFVPERSGIKLREPGYGLGQLGIQFQRLLKSCGRLVGCASFFVSFPQTHLDDDVVRLLLGHSFELRDRQCGVALEQGETAFALVLTREIFGCFGSFFEGDPGEFCLAHHVRGHGEVKLNHRIIGSFLSALLENWQSSLILAAFVKDPAQGIGDRSVLPQQLPGFTG